MSNQPEALLLDLDGTQLLTEQRNKRVHETTAQKYNAWIDKCDWADLAGTSDTIIWNHLKNTFNLFSIGEADYVAEIEKGYMTDMHGVGLRPGMSEIFERAKARGIPVATVTNSPRDIALAGLKYAGIDTLMTTIITRDDVLRAGRQTKPAPDPYLMAAESLGVKIGNCLIAEDARNGAKAGLLALRSCPSGGTRGAVIQILDDGDESQFVAEAHVHARDRDQLVAAFLKYMP